MNKFRERKNYCFFKRQNRQIHPRTFIRGSTSSLKFCVDQFRVCLAELRLLQKRLLLRLLWWSDFSGRDGAVLKSVWQWLHLLDWSFEMSKLPFPIFFFYLFLFLSFLFSSPFLFLISFSFFLLSSLSNRPPSLPRCVSSHVFKSSD